MLRLCAYSAVLDLPVGTRNLALYTAFLFLAGIASAAATVVGVAAASAAMHAGPAPAAATAAVASWGSVWGLCFWRDLVWWGGSGVAGLAVATLTSAEVFRLVACAVLVPAGVAFFCATSTWSLVDSVHRRVWLADRPASARPRRVRRGGGGGGSHGHDH